MPFDRPSIRPLNPVFEIDFVVDPPQHCFYDQIDQRWTQLEQPEGEPVECRDWRGHPARRGQPPFMRFIHAFADQVDKERNPFTFYPRWRCYFEYWGVRTSDGRFAYAETYLNLDPERDIAPTVRLFLRREDYWGRIECYDESLREACEQAAAAMRQSYVDEEEAVPA